MFFNFPSTGNSLFCFLRLKNATLSDDEEEEYPKVVNTMGDMTIKHAVLTREVMETVIRPTSHLRESKKIIAQEIRERKLTAIEERIFKEGLLKKLLTPPDLPGPTRETLDPFDPRVPIKKKKDHWWKISKKPKKIPEGKLIDLSPSNFPFRKKLYRVFLPKKFSP